MSTLLETQGLTKTFAGVTALEDVDFRLERGERRAIIGPNGAGKTTFANLVAGRLQPTRGRIIFRGEDITDLPSHRRARRGIVYTFQLTSVFPQLRVFDNVRLAVQSRVGNAGNPLGSASSTAIADRTTQILASVGIASYAGALAADLSHGDQRRLEIGLALGLEPGLLLLDEPTQGMGASEVAAIVALLRVLSETMSILLIEHNMDVVFQLAQRVTVLDRGRVLAEGSPDEISADARVQQAYLGRGP
jgi:branched-chain amino acid transport system ATP-binding protein